MGYDNPFKRPPRRNHFLDVLLRPNQPEPEKPNLLLQAFLNQPNEVKPKVDWAKVAEIIQPPRRVPRASRELPRRFPNPLKRVSLAPRYVYPFVDATERLKLLVWSLATPIPGYDPAIMRRDIFGSIMLYVKHGDTTSDFGWEIDHKIPVARNGDSSLENLEPLQWRNNRRKGDKPLWYVLTYGLPN